MPEPLTRPDASHLLRRVGFGGSPQDLDHFAGMNREDAVDEILSTNPPKPERPEFVDTHVVMPGLWALRVWWVRRMVEARWADRTAATPSPLEERMTLFWHSHFATDIAKASDLRTNFVQHEILRDRGRGRFHKLLRNVCTNGALLAFLDNQQNTFSTPQENFGRELMELYTIGPDEFVESDVIEMSRAWSGHGTRGWTGFEDLTYRYWDDDHDHGRKVLFGLPPQRWNGPETLELFTGGVKSEATATFIARKIWRFFVNGSPTADEVATIAGASLPDLHITDLLRATLLHPTFWDPSTRLALVKSPIAFVVDVIRRLGLDVSDANINVQLPLMGQIPFSPPSVAGWGTDGDWVSTGASNGRASFLASIRFFDAAESNFDGILDLPSAAHGAALIASVFGIDDPSEPTLRALRDFWTAHAESTVDRWAARVNSTVVGGMMPEFHVV